MVHLINFPCLNVFLTFDENTLLMKNKTTIVKAVCTIGLFAVTTSASAQQWGDYTLYSLQNGTSTYLIDTNSTVYHTWTHSSAQTGYSSYLLPGGNLLRTVKVTNSTFNGGGMTGKIQTLDWNSNVVWSYTISSTTESAHHDICPMPNGNVLAIVYESKTSSEVTQAGCSSAITMWPDKIVEIQPTGSTTGTVVWEWHLWDHLCQSYNSAKDNYVTSVGDHPELYNINTNPQKEVWHMNGIDYNPILDQISISAHNTSEMYIIDHSTTTSEAAGHTGGLGGRGGDFLYRWGKPSNYGQTGTTILNVVHDAHWIPEGVPNAGRIVGFNNNGISSSQSCIDQVATPLTGYTYSYTPNTAYAPSTYTQRHACNGYSSNMGNSQQLPNGNMLVCVATAGYMYEIDPSGTTIWSKTATGTVPQAFRYSACYVSNAAPAIPTITANGNVLTSSAATTYQWYLNGVQIAGATSQSYTATQDGVYLVRITDANGCVYEYSTNYIFTLSTAVNDIDIAHLFDVFPNPTTGLLGISGQVQSLGNYEVRVLDATGKLVIDQQNNALIDLTAFNNGIYFLVITSENAGVIRRKIVLTK